MAQGHRLSWLKVTQGMGGIRTREAQRWRCQAITAALGVALRGAAGIAAGRSGFLFCGAILPGRIASVSMSPAWHNGLYDGTTTGAVRAESTRPTTTDLGELGGRMGFDLPATNSALTIVSQQSPAAERAPPGPAATGPEP